MLGDAHEGLISVCREENAALVAVGSSGRGLLAGALTGGSAATLSSACGCPVMVVPPDAQIEPLVQPSVAPSDERVAVAAELARLAA